MSSDAPACDESASCSLRRMRSLKVSPSTVRSDVITWVSRSTCSLELPTTSKLTSTSSGRCSAWSFMGSVLTIMSLALITM
eukprot:CAMPEP_0168483242 /NCGR_PEP_ID=MMETSP0228-20121227/65466_1 /TAXON_ID=133427 /ORGANISM="Protoceratium reticulatum, Strain CCCM 535 (=CCMP 1889)" /LENGTH=80 /DNA_ID=CAMNT_0008499715 /DNA_START=296 /DNA_END=538 /DNA_ORIENTATION=+